MNSCINESEHAPQGLNTRRLSVTDDDVKSLVGLIRENNNFLFSGPHKDAIPFHAGGKLLGLIKEAFVPFLARYPGVFRVEKAKYYNGYPEKISCVIVSEKLDTCEARTTALKAVVDDLRQHSSVLTALKGWRDEDYAAYYHFHDGPVFRMERAATSIFGIRRYGVHTNGYVRNPETGAIDKMWIGERAMNKPTYPGQLDNMAAGGLTAGYQITDVARKELQEEASIPGHLIQNLRCAGTISYCFEDSRGILPENLFIYDLELPADFTPVNSDGEVQGFVLKTIPEVFKMIQQPNFKPNSALVVLDFLIRHGFFTPEHTPYYGYLLQNMHVDPFAHFSHLVHCPPLV